MATTSTGIHTHDAEILLRSTAASTTTPMTTATALHGPGRVAASVTMPMKSWNAAPMTSPTYPARPEGTTDVTARAAPCPATNHWNPSGMRR